MDIGKGILAKFRELDTKSDGTIEVSRLRKVLQGIDKNFFTQDCIDRLTRDVLKMDGNMVRYESLLTMIGVIQPPGSIAYYKDKARQAMRRDGVDRIFLTDSHWSNVWSRHFERGVNFDPKLYPFDKPTPPSFAAGENLRVLQWNVLAEGLVPEGFLMPLVSKEHIESMDRYLQKLLKSRNYKDLEQVAACSPEGYRGLVWRAKDNGDGDGVDEEEGWEEFSNMACNMVLSMKGLSPDKKKEKGLRLKKVYNREEASPGDEHKVQGGQLTINEAAVVGCEHRLLRVLWFVALMQPDIIALQELDNFVYMKEELKRMGYACGTEDAEVYVPLKDRPVDSKDQKGAYLKCLQSSSWAFAPKTNRKKGKSTARHFLEQRIAGKTGTKAQFNEQDGWLIDDDGQAIFWRESRFQLVGRPEFIVLPGDKEIEHFIHGGDTTDFSGDQAAVRVMLQFRESDPKLCGQRFYVSTTHLTSGTDEEVERIYQLRQIGSEWGCTDLPQIWALDANTEIDFEDLDNKRGSAVAIPREANALQSFMRDNDLRSVWDSAMHAGNPPVSVWKMRGSASVQPKKVGEDMYQLIDHIFYNGRTLIKPGQQALRLRERKTEDLANRDWLSLMPNELLPSDHLPIAWDFQLNIHNARWEAHVLLDISKLLFDKFSEATTKSGNHPDLPGLLNTLNTLVEPKQSDGAVPSESVAVEQRLETWLQTLVHEAMDIIQIGDDRCSKLDKVRNRIIHLFGGGSHEDSALNIIYGFLLSAAAMAATGEHLFCRHVLSSEDRTHLALAAMRCLARSVNEMKSLERVCGWSLREGQVWSLIAQLTEVSSSDFPRIVSALDNQGIVTASDLDDILVEIGDALNIKSRLNQPALLVIRCIKWSQCATGPQVATAVEQLLHSIETGDISYRSSAALESGPSSPAVQRKRSGSEPVADKRSQPVITPLGFGEKQTFDQTAAISALKTLAGSGKLDSSGGLSLLFKCLRGHLEIAYGCAEQASAASDDQTGDAPQLSLLQRAERQARIFNRPPPLYVATFVRRAVVHACEHLEPLDVLIVPVQQQDYTAVGSRNAKINFVIELLNALRIIPQENKHAQVNTMGRILRLLANLCVHVGAAPMVGPIVQASAMDKFMDLLENATEDPNDDDLQRWKMHLQLSRLLDSLLYNKIDARENAVARALQDILRSEVEKPEFLKLFMQRPSMSDCGRVDHAKTSKELNKFSLVSELQSKYDTLSEPRQRM
jgi:hypothetical protein